MSTLLEQASLVLIPSGYAEDKVYSVIPSDGSGDMSFTRASDGTRINFDGLVEVCPWNLQTYSEDFSNGAWTKSNSPTMTYNIATAPNGTMTADSIQSNTASVYQSVSAPLLSIAPNSTVTLSIYIKKETSKTYFTGTYLYFTGGTTKLTYVLFDEVNGTINIVAPDQVSMVTSVESVGDWWRFIVTGTDTGGNTNLDYAFYGTLSQNGTTLDTGIGSARTIWGAQLNIGSTAKPYFPTTDRLNVPRLTYQNGGGGCPSLLLEKQSTNVVTYSEQFDNAAWTKQNVTITANSVTSPDGTQNADTITSTAASPNTLSPLASFAATTNVSIFVKYVSQRWVQLMSGGAFNGYANFDIQNGVIGTVGSNASNAQIENFGNGWYRISVNLLGFTGNTNLYFGFIASGTSAWNTFDPNFNKSLYAWGCQIENSSYPTSYIPTTSSSATRIADACLSIGTPLLLNDFSFFMSIKFSQVDQGLGYMLFGSIDAGSTSYIYSDSAANMSFNTGATSTAIGTAGLSINTDYKICFVRSGTSLKYFRNGALINTFTVQSNQFKFTSFCNGVDPGGVTSKYNTLGLFSQGIVFTNALTNAEAITLTTI